MKCLAFLLDPSKFGGLESSLSLLVLSATGAACVPGPGVWGLEAILDSMDSLESVDDGGSGETRSSRVLADKASISIGRLSVVSTGVETFLGVLREDNPNSSALDWNGDEGVERWGVWYDVGARGGEGGTTGSSSYWKFGWSLGTW